MHESITIPLAKGQVDGDVVMISCPYCERIHKHGYGEGTYPAHRVSHCHQEKAAAGYMVVIAEKSI